MDEKIHAKGNLFELVHLEQSDGRVFEVARRAPGVRLIIENSRGEILLTREYRRELGTWDYRLPGGKVFDSLEAYEAHRRSGRDIVESARKKAIAEAREEAGVDVSELELYKKSTLGATVEWDLYIFQVNDWQYAKEGQALERGEEIEADSWFNHAQVEKMILNGDMQEERVALALLQWVRKSRVVA